MKPVAWMVILPAGSRVDHEETRLYYKEDWPKAHAAHGSKVIPLYALPNTHVIVPREPTEEILERLAEHTYGHPRAKAIEWGKEDKFDNHVTMMRETYRAVIYETTKENT